MPPDAIDLAAVKRVLVVKLRHLGDVLLTSPMFSALKSAAPHIEADALVYDDCRAMLEGHPAVAQIWTISRAWRSLPAHRRLAAEWHLLRRLQERDYQLLIHLTDHPRGAWLARWLNVRYSVAGRRPGRWWKKSFTHFCPRPPHAYRHTVELHLDALRRLGVAPGDKRLLFVPGEAAETAVANLLADRGLEAGKYIHFHPVSRWFFKCWPAAAAAAFTKLADMPVVVTAAPKAEEMAQVAAIASAGGRFVDLSGKLSLAELGALSAASALFVGVDSAPMHMAAAVGKPVVALFGPSGEKEWGPWLVPQRLVAADFSCRPCGLDGCGGSKRSDCLGAIPPERVWREAEELLAEVGGRV